MCIEYAKSALHRRSLHPAIRYRDIISRAICSTEYNYSYNKTIHLCAECSVKNGSGTPQFFIQHKLLISYEGDFPFCDLCHTSLHITRQAEECAECADEFFPFINHIIQEENWQIGTANPAVLYHGTGPSDIIISRRLAAFSLSLLKST